MLKSKDQKNITHKTITTSCTTSTTIPLNDAAQAAVIPAPASTESACATAATTAPAVSTAATEPSVQLRQVSWYKRRRPDPLEQQPQVL